ncbi:MAG: glycosyltransferase family 4 protein [Saprospiraceae bacterium]|nr:glycosyltransferase family 4 protein [Saprospiraceae bacterium]
MKIAFDAKRFYNNATGLGFYSRTLVNSLRLFYPHHDYLLYTPYDKGRLVADKKGMRLPDSWFGRLTHPLWRSKHMVSQLKRDAVSLYHGLSHELPIGLKKAGIPGVVTMHDLIFLRYPEFYPALDHFFYQKKYNRSAHAADIVVAISEQTRSDVAEFFKVPLARIKVIGQSCDPVFSALSLFKHPDRGQFPLPADLDIPDADYLIAVGSLTPRKNWHRLIEALALVREAGVDIPLVAVGAGNSPYAQSLVELAVSKKVKVFWVKRHLPSDQLSCLYRRANALVYPSVFEGFGIPILEALTCGIPVVTSQGSCFSEVGGQAALYTDPSDPASLADGIFQVLTSTTRRQLLAFAPEQVVKFSPEIICRQWMDVYEELVTI